MKRLAMTPLRKVFIKDEYTTVDTLQEVTEDFKRCVVRFASESHEFEVDGMKFKVTCERIDG